MRSLLRFLALALVAFSWDIAMWVVTSDVGISDGARLAMIAAGNIVLLVGMLKGRPLNG